MATIVLQAAGAAVGGIVGGPFGAIAGRALGGLAGRAVDERLFARTRSVEGARLTGSRLLDADEGAGISRVYGTARVAGQVIWMTRFEETRNTERQGGKGGPPSVESVTYEYFGNFAVGLCEGPVAYVRRVWADGEEMDLAEIEMRFHSGGEDQMPDPLIEAKQGTGNAPAYRGLAYIVFERLPLARWGNRVPQIACEVVRPIGALERDMRAVTIIPGANEHGLDPQTVRERVGEGEDRLVNRNVSHGANDFSASLEELTALCPALERAALVVAWFADDLRAGTARVMPGVESVGRDESEEWRVGGLKRGEAHLVSRVEGGPAYGGTPSDAGVIRALMRMKAEGLAVTYYPFLLMDVAADNELPDPHGGERQAAYPWRGRMSVSVAEGRPGSPDGTAGTRGEIAAFVGTAGPGDFTLEGGAIAYDGPAEWSYRRMILHQAWLARAAGGVDAFVIGSEMRGLTRIRDGEGRFPFVEALIALARDVKAVLPEAKVTYAADWSEYFGYQPTDGTGDVFYNLDPLWADKAIDMVGIDNYLPLADWRAEDWAKGGPDGGRSPYDRQALHRGIAGGEHFDWYYASEADRRARLRSPITDGAGKPWVYRAKDIASWWASPHFDRRGGVAISEASAWVPRSKPVWLTELGCPAVDKGANQPNVFVDAKSAESALPHFSTGARDDHQQRRFLEAHLEHWAAGEDGNPVSPFYGGPMVDPAAIHLWTWDARPYPAFPQASSLWRDGPNWTLGHWLTGRLGKAPLDALIAAILTDHGFTEFDVSGVDGEVGGYLLQGPGSARGELEEIMRLTGIVAFSSAGRLIFRSVRGARDALVLETLAEEDDGPPISLRRSEASEVEDEVVVGFNDVARAYQPGNSSAALRSARQNRKRRIDLPVSLAESEAARFAAERLADGLGARETASFALSPTALELETGDHVALPGISGRWRIERIEDGAARRMEASRLPTAVREAMPGTGAGEEPPAIQPPPVASRPEVRLLDLPAEGGPEARAFAAIFARPWRAHTIGISAANGEVRARASATMPATIGRLAEPLGPGPEAVIDRAGRITVDLFGGALSSTSRQSLLSGANLAAVCSPEGGWEMLQFEISEEVAPMRFRLSGLLRALQGAEGAMRAGVPAGADFVLLDRALVPLPLTANEVGRLLDIRVTPSGRALDDPASWAGTAALGTVAERPLSPVHLVAKFEAGGDILFSWIRRTRIGGDRWEGFDVPLGEESERYFVRVDAAGGEPWRVETEAPFARLTAAEQSARFGAPPAALSLSVAQIGALSGPGAERSRAFTRP